MGCRCLLARLDGLGQVLADEWTHAYFVDCCHMTNFALFGWTCHGRARLFLSHLVMLANGLSNLIEHLFEKSLYISRNVRYHVNIPKKWRLHDETRQTD